MQVCKIVKDNDRYAILEQYYKEATDSLIVNYNDRNINPNIDYHKKEYLDRVYFDFAEANLKADIDAGYPVIFVDDQKAVDDLNEKFKAEQDSDSGPFSISNDRLQWNYDVDFNYIPTVAQARRFKRSMPGLIRIQDDTQIHEFLMRSVNKVLEKHKGKHGNFDTFIFEGPRARKRAKSFLHNLDKLALRGLVEGNLEDKDGRIEFSTRRNQNVYEAYKQFVREKYVNDYGINHIVQDRSVFQDPAEYLEQNRNPEVLMFDTVAVPQSKDTHKWVTNMLWRKAANAGLNVEVHKNIQEILKTRYGLEGVGGSAFADMNTATIFLAENANWQSLTEEVMHFLVELSWDSLTTDHNLFDDIIIHNHPIYIQHFPEYQAHYKAMADLYGKKATDALAANNITEYDKNNRIAEYLSLNYSELAYKEVIAKMLVWAIEQESKIFKSLNIRDKYTYKLVTSARDFWNWVVDILRKIRDFTFRLAPTNVERREFNELLRKWAQAVLSEKDFNTYKLRWNKDGIENVPGFNFLQPLNPDAKYQRTVVMSRVLKDQYDEESLRASVKKYKDVIMKLQEKKYDLPEFNNKYVLSQLIKVYQDQEIEALDRDPMLFKFFATDANTIKTLVNDGIAWLNANPTKTIPEFILYLVESRFNNTDLADLMAANPTNLAALKTDFTDTLDRTFKDYSVPGGLAHMEKDQIIDYMESFVDWVVAYGKGLDRFKNINDINKTVASTNRQLFYNNEFFALEKLLIGAEQTQLVPLLTIIRDVLESSISTRHYPYIHGIMNRVEQSLIVPGKKLNPDFLLNEFEKEFRNIRTTVTTLTTWQQSALDEALTIIEQEKLKTIPTVTPSGVTEPPVYSSVLRTGTTNQYDFYYTTYTGGLAGQMQDLLKYLETFKLGPGNYDVDGIDYKDYQYVHYLYHQLKDIVANVTIVHTNVKNNILKGRSELFVREEYDKAKMLYDYEYSIDPASQNTQIAYDAMEVAREDYRQVRIVNAMGDFLSAKPKTGSRKGFNEIFKDAVEFMGSAHTPLLIRFVRDTSTHPSIKYEKDPDKKYRRAKELVEKQLADVSPIENFFYSFGEDSNNLSMVVRNVLEHQKENINKRSESHNQLFESKVQELETELKSDPIVMAYALKRNATYLGSILHEYNRNGKKSGNFITPYRQDEFELEKEKIDDELLRIAEDIIANVSVNDPDVVGLYVPTHLQHTKHFGRAFSFKHESDREALFQHGVYDEIEVEYAFPRGVKTIPLSNYLRIVKAKMYADITRDPTNSELDKIEQTILLRKMQFTPVEFDLWYKMNVVVRGKRTIYMGELGIPADLFINPDFEVLNTSPTFQKYYKLVSDYLKQSNIKIGAAETTSWHKMPQVQRQAREIFNIASRMGWKMPLYNLPWHFGNKFKHIYTWSRNLVSQIEKFALREGEDQHTDVLNIPYRKVNTRYRMDIPSEELSDDVIGALMLYNQMADMVHYGTKAVELHDGLSRLLRDMPWVYTPSVVRTYQRIKRRILGNRTENLDMSIADINVDYSNFSGTLIPDREVFGDKPKLVRDQPNALPEIINAYEHGLEVTLNGPVVYAKGFWKYVYTLLTPVMHNISGLVLKWSGFTILSNTWASFTMLNSKYSQLAVYRGTGFASTGAYIMTRILIDYTRLLGAQLSKGAQFIWNASPLTWIKPWNSANGLTKLDYIGNIARVLETGTVRHPRQDTVFHNLSTVANWGAWEAADHMQHTFSLELAFENFRYSAHFGDWLTFEQYAEQITLQYRKPLKDLKAELKLAKERKYSASKIQEINDKISEIQKNLSNIPAFIGLKSMYDVIEFVPVLLKDNTQRKLDNINVKFSTKIAKQKIGDGSIVDVDYTKVGTDEALNAAMRQARNLKVSADGKERFPHQSLAATNPLAQIWLQMKRWILPNWKNSFAKNRWNEETNQFTAGFWPALLRIVSVSLNQHSLAKKFSAEHNAAINSGDTGAVARGVFMNAAVLMFLYAYKELEDEKCKNKTNKSAFVCTFLRILFLRAALESSTYVISPGFWGEFKTMLTRVPVTMDLFHTGSYYGYIKSAKNYIFGNDKQPTKSTYYKKHGPNEFVFFGDMYRRTWEEREKYLLEAATPARGLRTFTSVRNMEIYYNGMIKNIPEVADRADWLYGVVNGNKKKQTETKKSDKATAE